MRILRPSARPTLAMLGLVVNIFTLGGRRARAGALVVTFLVTAPVHAREFGEILEFTGSNLMAFCAALLTTPAQREKRAEATRAAITEKVETRLGYLPRLEYLDEGREDGIPLKRVAAYDPNDRLIGEMPVKVYSPTRLRMGLVKILDPNLKNKGISKLMFARLMQEHPRTIQVSTHLSFDNSKFVRDLWAGGTPCAEAVMLSPAARMRAHFGFTRRLNRPDCTGQIELILGR